MITQIPPCPSATATAAGVVTFTFQAPAAGETWTGALTIPNAPATAKFTAYPGNAGATPLASWVGQNTTRNIRTTQGVGLVVTGTGLLPGTTYSCNWTGQIVTNDLTIAQADTQNPNVSTVTEQIVLGGPLSYVQATTVTVTGVAAWRSLWVASKESVNANAPMPTLTGVQSGFNYQAFEPPYFTPLTQGFFRFPLIDGLDTTYTLAVSPNNNGGGTYWYGADLADIDAAVYPETNSLSATVNTSVVGAFPVATARFGTGAGISTVPLDVADMGGLQFVSGTISTTALTGIIGAPSAGLANRLHSFCTTTTTQTLALSQGANQPLCVLTSPGFALLGGRLTTGQINIRASGATTMSYEVGYDQVILPTLN